MEHSFQGQQNSAAYLIRDPLTGAYSRGLLESRLIEETARSGREKIPLTLCVFTLDRFQTLRAQWGPRRVDQILRELTSLVQKKMRSSDVLFRSGAEEFVLMLPSTSKKNAIQVCERLLERVAVHPFAGEPVLFQSISVGLASYPEDSGRVSELMQVARKRNAWASEQGRNRFVTEDLRDVPLVHFDHLTHPIEREDHLEAFQAFLDMLEIKQKGLFTLAGQPDSGRSFFLNYLAQTARAQNYAVLMLTPSESLQAIPHGVLQQAKWDHPLPVHEGPRSVVAALQQGCQGKMGLIITIDEGTLLDPTTCRTLQQILDGLSLPVALMMSCGIKTLLSPFQVPLETRVSLTPLSREGMKAWLTEVLNWEAPFQLQDWCYRQSDGYPGRAKKTLGLLMSQGVLRPLHSGWELASGWETRLDQWQNQ
ncbi:GGDEF domain-containing protein [Deinococcus cellulosilyticus]|uniref:GGDEF domain-containing protein n=1 Tax=Deinococcus cellulosilyticus (strain DSM 18568 / NBRC 106333 / KACC 11606 / 5516J-15) TaxID=1223518 RepID=A0A511N4K8_DEIC1|nr:GGDEF domain-containing protein [Deinococcus cellulosilyticus]GEM47407.1 hypothetical protein DC3_30420 [Deinococcus cellulosilyticus NBRC 106333 = KACC 11606]